MKRAIVLAAVLAGVLVVATVASRARFQDPASCNSCHFIEPYYKKWATSTHKAVPCLKCHEYGPARALLGQAMFLAGAYNPRPLTRVPDSSCLQSGCHDQRLVQSKVVFTKRGITFDHKPHFNEMKRGIKLHCRSCHSDIVQGEHLKVSMDVCFLCHFMGAALDKVERGCPTCHGAPAKELIYKGQPFSHAEALGADQPCHRCHLEITRGDGVAAREKCYFCHVDRAEKYSDVKLVHDKHVTEKQIDCLYCHPRLEHGKFKMADDAVLRPQR